MKKCSRSWLAQIQMPKMRRKGQDKSHHGTATWKVTLKKSVLNAAASWRTTRVTNFIRCPQFVPMITKCKQKRNCGRIVRTLHSDWTNMLVFGQNWKTRFTLDSELLDDISHKSGTERATCDSHVSSFTFITHPTTDSVATWGIKQQTANFDYSKTPMSAGNLTVSKSNSGGVVLIFGSHTFVPFWWTQKKSIELYPIAALKLKLYRSIQGYALSACQHWICETES